MGGWSLMQRPYRSSTSGGIASRADASGPRPRLLTSYALTWVGTIYGILWYVVVGAILAAVMKKAPAAA